MDSIDKALAAGRERTAKEKKVVKITNPGTLPTVEKPQYKQPPTSKRVRKKTPSFLKKYALRGGLVAGLALGVYEGAKKYVGQEEPTEHTTRVNTAREVEKIYIAPATANISALAESMSAPTNSAPTAEELRAKAEQHATELESAQMKAQNAALKAQIEAMEKAKAKADARPNLNNDEDFFNYFSQVPRPPMTADDVIRWNNGLPGWIRGNR